MTVEASEGQVSAPPKASDLKLFARERRQSRDRRFKEDRRSVMNGWRFAVAVEQRHNWSRRSRIERRD